MYHTTSTDNSRLKELLENSKNHLLEAKSLLADGEWIRLWQDFHSTYKAIKRARYDGWITSQKDKDYASVHLIKIGILLNKVLRFREAQQCFQLSWSLQKLYCGGELESYATNKFCKTTILMVNTSLQTADGEGALHTILEAESFCDPHKQKDAWMIHNNEKLKYTLGSLYLELAQYELDVFGEYQHATELLTKAEGYIIPLTEIDSHRRRYMCCKFKILSLQGIMRLAMSRSFSDALEDVGRVRNYFDDALLCAAELNWMPHDSDSVMNCFKFYLKLLATDVGTSEEKERIVLHNMTEASDKVWTKWGLHYQAGNAFADIGNELVQQGMHQNATYYLAKAIEVHREGLNKFHQMDCLHALLLNLKSTAYCYHKENHFAGLGTEISILRERLEVLDKHCPNSRKSDRTETLACLGRAYQQVGDVVRASRCYQRALLNEHLLDNGHLQHIHVNLGYLLHLKASQYLHVKDSQSVDRLLAQADQAFMNALNDIHKWDSNTTASFLFNYGLYLFKRCNYSEASKHLLQGYLSGKKAKNWTVFTKVDYALLDDHLKIELKNTRLMTLAFPTSFVCLYFRAKSLALMKDTNLAVQNILQLQEDIETRTVFHNMSGVHMSGIHIHPEYVRAVCYSLLGYCYRAVGNYAESIRVFLKVKKLLPHHHVAPVNHQQEPHSSRRETFVNHQHEPHSSRQETFV